MAVDVYMVFTGQNAKQSAIPSNANLNRYRNIVAYDSTRVTVEKSNFNSNNDYINANWVPGYKQKRGFVVRIPGCRGSSDGACVLEHGLHVSIKLQSPPHMYPVLSTPLITLARPMWPLLAVGFSGTSLLKDRSQNRWHRKWAMIGWLLGGGSGGRREGVGCHQS